MLIAKSGRVWTDQCTQTDRCTLSLWVRVSFWFNDASIRKIKYGCMSVRMMEMPSRYCAGRNVTIRIWQASPHNFPVTGDGCGGGWICLWHATNYILVMIYVPLQACWYVDLCKHIWQAPLA